MYYNFTFVLLEICIYKFDLCFLEHSDDYSVKFFPFVGATRSANLYLHYFCKRNADISIILILTHLFNDAKQAFADFASA